MKRRVQRKHREQFTLFKLYVSLAVIFTLTTTVVFAEEVTNPGKIKTTSCAACHGEDGNTTLSNTPKLAGQHIVYLIKQLNDIKQGDKKGRPSPVMYSLVQTLSAADIRDIAHYYAMQQTTLGAAKPSLVNLGQRLYRGGNSNKGIAACAACHGPRGEGNELAGFPLLQGQNADYVILQLKAFREGTRANDPNHIMRDIASRMSDDEIISVASYIAGLH